MQLELGKKYCTVIDWDLNTLYYGIMEKNPSVDHHEYQQERFGNIETYTSFSGNKTLAIVLSGASNVFTDFQTFLGNLGNTYDVIYVDDGYYGLSDDGNDPDPTYSTNYFTVEFFNHYKDILSRYKKVIMIGQSYGAIEAIKLRQKIPSAGIVLASPPFSEFHFREESACHRLLNLFLKTKLGQSLVNKSKAEKILKRELFRFLPRNTGNVIKRVRLKSYLHCLAEIFVFGKINPEIIPDDWLIFIGKNDVYLRELCIQDKLKERKNTHLLPCGHTILQTHWSEVMEEMRNEFTGNN